MMLFCQKRSKQKKFKMLYVKMSQFTEAKINAILREYFNLCVIIFQIKSKVNYTWNLSFDIEDIIALFQQN